MNDVRKGEIESMRSLKRAESLIERIKPLEPPERWEKRENRFYGLQNGEWIEWPLEAITLLKDAIKQRYEAALKRFETADIDVRIITEDSPPEPEPLYRWPDGWELEENGIHHNISIGMMT